MSRHQKKKVKKVRIFDAKKIEPNKHLLYAELEVHGAPDLPAEKLPAEIQLDDVAEEPKTGIAKWWHDLWNDEVA